LEDKPNRTYLWTGCREWGATSRMGSRFLDLASGRKVRPLIMMTNKRNTHVMRTIKSFIFLCEVGDVY
jgi:hypothetical protein